MRFQAIVKDLSSPNIDEKDISKKIVDGVYYLIGFSDNNVDLIRLLVRAKNILLRARQDNAYVNNILNYLLYDIESVKDIKEEIIKRCGNVETHFDLFFKKAIDEGSRKIKDNSRIFVLGYSKLILDILKTAKERGKNFTVNNIESRPNRSGRVMADEISKIGIHVNHYPDSAVKFALKDCDFALINAMGIYEKKIISDLGVNNIVEFCEKHEMPVYVCLDSWRYGKKNLNHANTKQKNINLINPEFEEANLDNVLVISELGIYNGKNYLGQLRSIYPWITFSY